MSFVTAIICATRRFSLIMPPFEWAAVSPLQARVAKQNNVTDPGKLEQKHRGDFTRIYPRDDDQEYERLFQRLTAGATMLFTGEFRAGV